MSTQRDVIAKVLWDTATIENQSAYDRAGAILDTLASAPATHLMPSLALPDCMMPDGGQACTAYRDLSEEYQKTREVLHTMLDAFDRCRFCQPSKADEDAYDEACALLGRHNGRAAEGKP